MAISMCSGRIGWHRDHDTLTLTVWRTTEAKPSSLGSQYVEVQDQIIAEIQLGCSATITDGGVTLEIKNDPVAVSVTG